MRFPPLHLIWTWEKWKIEMGKRQVEERKDGVMRCRNPNTDADKSDTQPLIDSMDTHCRLLSFSTPPPRKEIPREVHALCLRCSFVVPGPKFVIHEALGPVASISLNLMELQNHSPVCAAMQLWPGIVQLSLLKDKHFSGSYRCCIPTVSILKPTLTHDSNITSISDHTLYVLLF